MERGKRVEGVDGEIHWHEAIIQHIQSFLSCKEAARTSILCKSWYNAWATRPIVDLDQRHFRSRGGGDPRRLIADWFLEVSKKTMRRYEELKLKIETFRVCMENIKSDCFSRVNELIVDAMKLGACELNVEIMNRPPRLFYLPNEVLRSENLVRLSVSGCRIDLEATGGKVGFSKLKSLSIRDVCIVGISTLDIASDCPLIEELVLSHCICISIDQSSNGDTAKLTRTLTLGSLTEFAKRGLGSIVDAPIRLYNNLKRLYLEMIQIDKLLFNDMSRRFPGLKDLSLKWCSGFNGLQVSSPSLEFLSIEQMEVMDVKFDVPSLRKFTFLGTVAPCLSFEATPRDWESDISVEYFQDYVRSYWLDMLKISLMKLRLSKITLSLYLGISGIRYPIGRVPVLPNKPEVENLMLWMSAPTPVCSSLLKRVFGTCRPKFITLGWLSQSFVRLEENRDMLKLLCKILIDKESCIPSQPMFKKYGLKKVDVEVFEDSLAEWQPLPWKALVDASKSPEKKQKIRFKLGW